MHAEQLLFLKSAMYQWLNRIKLGKIDPDQIRSVLVVKCDEIGDMVNALHIFPLLRKALPHAEIELYCKKMNTPLVRNFEEISRIHHTPNELKSHYDLRIDLRGNRQSLQMAKKDASAHYLGRGKVRIINKLKGKQAHEVITNHRILAPILNDSNQQGMMPSFRWSESEKHKVEQFVERIAGPFCVFHIGARDAARRWPQERFAELISYLALHHDQRIVIGGGPDEQQMVDDFLKTYEIEGLNLCGLFNVNEFAFLCSKATLFVGNESGPLHLAWVSSCPSIGLFGPGVPEIFYPIGNQHRVIHHYMGHQPGNPASMLKIDVAEVKEYCDELLLNSA
jgi:ADP-heptose:LPS heptosyltransferase